MGKTPGQDLRAGPKPTEQLLKPGTTHDRGADGSCLALAQLPPCHPISSSNTRGWWHEPSSKQPSGSQTRAHHQVTIKSYTSFQKQGVSDSQVFTLYIHSSHRSDHSLHAFFAQNRTWS